MRPWAHRRGRVPGRAGDVEMRPRHVADEVRQERGADDRAGLARFGRVVEVAVGALDQLVVLGVQRQAPDDLAGALAGRRDLLRRARRRCPSGPRRSSRARRSPRRSAWPGRRAARRPASSAWQRQSASTSRPSASVLLTSIVRPLDGGDDVARLDRVPARQVLGRADDGDQLDRQAAAARSRRPPRSRPRRRTCRTSSRPSSRRASARCRRCRT